MVIKIIFVKEGVVDGGGKIAADRDKTGVAGKCIFTGIVDVSFTKGLNFGIVV